MSRARLLHLFFAIGIILKGADGVLEVAGGVTLLAVNPAQVTAVVRDLTQHELSEDPHDLVAHYLRNSAEHLGRSTQLFAAFYLLWHGLVKVGLVIALWLKRHWAYPVAIGAFVLFLVYQLYRFTHTHSVELLILSATDVVVIWLTWVEYQRLRAAHAFAR